MKAARNVLPPAGVLGRVASMAIRLWSGPTGRNKARLANTEAWPSRVRNCQRSSEIEGEANVFEHLMVALIRKKGTKRLMSALPIAQFFSILLPIVPLLLLPAWAAAQTPSTPVPATFFGQNLIGPIDYPNVAIGSMGKECCAEWGWIEPNAPVGAGCPGVVNCVHTYTWTTLDAFVSQANSHGDLFMFTYDEAPPWATSSVGCLGGNPNQCTGPLTDLPDFDAFMVALAARYDGAHGHGLIDTYEIANEQDFTGTQAQLAMQSDHLVKAVHSVNPTALIVGMGYAQPDTYYSPGNQFDAFWTAWGAIPGNVRHLDAMSFHGYPHGCCGGSLVPVPEVVAGPCVPDTGPGGSGFADCARQAAIRHGMSSTIPLIDSEGSWGINATVNFTTAQQVAFVGRFELLNWSAGVSRQNWYSWDNSAWGTMATCSGGSCTVNAAGVAYAQVYNWMVGSTMTKACAVESGTVWTCTLTRPNGYQALAVWNTSGSSAYTPPTLYTQYKDLAGNTTPLGTTVTIGIQPIMLESTTATQPSPPTNLIGVAH